MNLLPNKRMLPLLRLSPCGPITSQVLSEKRSSNVTGGARAFLNEAGITLYHLPANEKSAFQQELRANHVPQGPQYPFLL